MQITRKQRCGGDLKATSNSSCCPRRFAAPEGNAAGKELPTPGFCSPVPPSVQVTAGCAQLVYGNVNAEAPVGAGVSRSG